MFPKNTSDAEYPRERRHAGTRQDGRNLVEEWKDRVRNMVGPRDASGSYGALGNHVLSPTDTVSISLPLPPTNKKLYAHLNPPKKSHSTLNVIFIKIFGTMQIKFKII